MADESESPIKYPCYFLHGKDNGLITNFVDGRRCLCLFTSTEAVRRFAVEARDIHEHKRGYRKAPVDEVKDRAGLVDRLENAVDRLAADGIKFISIDPVPGQPTKCASIPDFIQKLRGG